MDKYETLHEEDSSTTNVYPNIKPQYNIESKAITSDKLADNSIGVDKLSKRIYLHNVTIRIGNDIIYHLSVLGNNSGTIGNITGLLSNIGVLPYHATADGKEGINPVIGLHFNTPQNILIVEKIVNGNYVEITRDYLTLTDATFNDIVFTIY